MNTIVYFCTLLLYVQIILSTDQVYRQTTEKKDTPETAGQASILSYFCFFIPEVSNLCGVGNSSIRRKVTGAANKGRKQPAGIIEKEPLGTGVSNPNIAGSDTTSNHSPVTDQPKNNEDTQADD